ncbi:uncharacterized protein BJ171DRAFT_488634 [Polychytrium aggregatum]|uniref:uncharacterized protein n=1 Tax=Polychytrium aggregatum TaxID=110093 RepID=UPI0022FF21E9|nr:uncharacterized protein BJ171DRAFT_488634 [Polychytrium aggregatum]KAI9209145.1 hypothetical protein BJ171DRAFT_488634 [Polychytrium aggregatum]
MGLCKCRTVTNLFCFEHRKNVCEKCIVTDHPKCVVRSYLQWLQDSDYDPVCAICSGALDQGELVRLTCLDLFHVDCIKTMCDKLPEHTAAAGYACPACHAPIIPAENMTGQIANDVRATFASCKWAEHVAPKRVPYVMTEFPKEVTSSSSAPKSAGPTGTLPSTPATTPAPQTYPPASVPSAPQSSTFSDGVSTFITTGVQPLAKKPSRNRLRDGDDDKYGTKSQGLLASLGLQDWDLSNVRHFTIKRAIIYFLLVAVLILVLRAYWVRQSAAAGNIVADSTGSE